MRTSHAVKRGSFFFCRTGFLKIREITGRTRVVLTFSFQRFTFRLAIFLFAKKMLPLQRICGIGVIGSRARLRIW